MRSGIIHALGVTILALILAPVLCVIWVSFAPGEVLELPTREWSVRWYGEFFGSRRWRAALWTTAGVAALSAALALTAGLALALAVTRHHFRGRRLIHGAALIPQLLPASVPAMGLLPLTHAVGLWGSVWSVAGAHALLSLPVAYLIQRSALEGIDPDVSRAARGLGATPSQAFRRVTLPLILPGVLSAALTAVVLSANEFTVALFLGTPGLRTLPAVIWPEVRDRETPLVAAASCVSVAMTVGVVGVAALLVSRRRA